MSAELLLNQLRDIHYPGEPFWWPPAIGWWLLFCIITLTVSSILYLYRIHQSNVLFRDARSILNNHKLAYHSDRNDSELLTEISIWLKQVSVNVFPESAVAGLHGKKWVSFLNQASHSHLFTEQHEQLFSESQYQKSVSFDGEELLNTCERWLTQVAKHIKLTNTN